MPELAEVELARRHWALALGETIMAIETHPRTRVFRNCPAATLAARLSGTTLDATRAHGKRLFFSFSPSRGQQSPAPSLHLELHLGMAGRLFAADPGYVAEKHDHFLLRSSNHSLVYSDYRQFGGLKLHESSDPWAALPPQILDRGFSLRSLTALLTRRPRVALKALLLDQSAFPGVGNWMADEICWRLPTHPATPVGRLDPAALRTTARTVCRGALKHIADKNLTLPMSSPEGFAPGSYVHLLPPRSWLFQHRWKPGGSCPRCQTSLARANVASRTTAWCPQCQRL